MSTILDVVIGLFFIYLVLALVTSTISELIAQLLALRGRVLRDGIRTMLSDFSNSGLADTLYKHPLISSLRPNRGKRNLVPGPKLPSYIPSHTFTLALLDIIVNENSNTFVPILDLERIKESVNTSKQLLMNEELKRQLDIILDLSEDIQEALLVMETWFNDTMNRARGWYKRRVQFIILLIAFLIAGFANADSIMLYNRLSTDATVRQAFVDNAGEFLETQPPITPADPEESADTETEATVSDITERIEYISELQASITNDLQVIGWSDEPGHTLAPPTTPTGWVMKVTGIVITALAVSLGAPFWYDLLSKLVNLRSSKPEPTGATERSLAPESANEADSGRSAGQ